MKIVEKNEKSGISAVFVGETEDKRGLFEFVSVEPEIDNGIVKKWVLILSTQLGCPVDCSICDAGGEFKRNLTCSEICMQADELIKKRNIDTRLVKKFKIQFARMGEPALNHSVIDAMMELKAKYGEYIPCISTVGPAGTQLWFERLMRIRDNFIDFQIQFSLFTTNEIRRNEMIRFPKLSFQWINEYGREFYRRGKRKIVLNFPLDESLPVDADEMAVLFDKKSFIAKFTPINPTERVKESGYLPEGYYNRVEQRINEIIKSLNEKGFDTIKSIGEMMENDVGSNCGQSVVKMKKREIEYLK
ncbi:MAG: radical SAM protein [bacterium]